MRISLYSLSGMICFVYEKILWDGWKLPTVKENSFMTMKFIGKILYLLKVSEEVQSI